MKVIIEGMTCSGCSGRVEKAIKAVPGIQGSLVILISGKFFETRGSRFLILSQGRVATRSIPAFFMSVITSSSGFNMPIPSDVLMLMSILSLFFLQVSINRFTQIFVMFFEI